MPRGMYRREHVMGIMCTSVRADFQAPPQKGQLVKGVATPHTMYRILHVCIYIYIVVKPVF